MDSEYADRKGYERAMVWIQSVPKHALAYGLGTFLLSKEGVIRSPIMRDGAELYPWLARLGWKAAADDKTRTLYERPEGFVIDPVYLGQTSDAVEAYDRIYAEHRTSVRGFDLETEAIERVRHAFARDTADRNSYAHAKLISVCRPDAIGGRSYLRELVNLWRQGERPDNHADRSAILGAHV